jgi:hypothetical protein
MFRLARRTSAPANTANIARPNTDAATIHRSAECSNETIFPLLITGVDTAATAPVSFIFPSGEVPASTFFAVGWSNEATFGPSLNSVFTISWAGALLARSIAAPKPMTIACIRRMFRSFIWAPLLLFSIVVLTTPDQNAGERPNHRLFDYGFVSFAIELKTSALLSCELL